MLKPSIRLSSKTLLIDYSEQIFELYFKSDFKLGKFYKSPLRSSDTNASFNIFKTKEGILLYKDWGKKSGNAIDFVMELKSLNFNEAYKDIIKSIGNKIKFTHTIKRNVKVKEVIIKIHPFLKNNKPIYTFTDNWYWYQRLGIPRKQLLKHKVLSLEKAYINGIIFGTYARFHPMYCYIEEYKNKQYFKLYRPFEKENKWRSNIGGLANKLLHGLNLLPSKGDTLIITKSVKDAIILDFIGFNVISTQGEDIPIDINIMKDLKNRFKDIFLLYDNDYSKIENHGKILSNKYSKLYNINQIIIPESIKATDTEELLILYKKDYNKLKTKINTWMQY